MPFGGIAKNIYTAFFDLLDDDPTFNYFKTKQRGFYPRDPDNIPPTMYPWVFIEYGGIGEIAVIAAPRVWGYEFTLVCVALTFADRGDPTNLVFTDGSSDNKGIGDIAADISNVFWTNMKENHFGVSGVRDWTIGRIGVPSVLSVQRLMLTSPYVRGVQLDFVFDIKERT